jgi:predicted kinase
MYPGKVKRVNKDDLRAMIDDGQWSKTNENFIVETRDKIIEAALSKKISIIVDDTNFDKSHSDRLKTLALKYEAEFKEHYIDVPLHECIKRDKLRPNPVGEQVIKRMYYQHVKKDGSPNMVPIPDFNFNPQLEDIYIFDIDGTTALNLSGRNWYDENNVDKDSPFLTVIHTLQSLSLTHSLIGLSGRKETCQALTEKWLIKYGVKYKALYMRPADDNRPDAVIKEELYNKHIKDKYNVVAVFDDRDQVVDLWRNKLKLTCFQVNYGNF